MVGRGDAAGRGEARSIDVGRHGSVGGARGDEARGAFSVTVI